VGTDPSGAGEYRDYEPGHSTPGLDPEKKALAASERRAEDRTCYREQVTPLEAQRLVFVDESGANIALTPL